MKALVVTALAIVGLAVAAFTAGSWVAPFLAFVGANTDLIQGLADLIQIALWIVTGVAAIVGLWWARSRRASPSSAVTRPGIVNLGNKSVVAGGDIVGNTITYTDRPESPSRPAQP